MKTIVIFALAVVLPSLITCAAVKNLLDDEQFIHPNKDDQWMDYKIRFRKDYLNEAEERGRYFSWRRHIKFIEKHNSRHAKGFQLGVNHFSDMEHSEFLEKMGGCLKVPQELMIDNRTLRRHPLASEFLPPQNLGTLPDSVDWREKGAVTPVKNQGQCGSCWAFSSTGALEGQWFRRTNKLPNLSEQNLVDCVTKNFACRGGWPDFAFEYVKKNDGIDDELGYPYYAKPLGYCYYRKTYRSASDVGFEDVSAGDEKMLKIAVATRGPVSVAIDARHPKFMAYKSGVYVDKECGNTLTSLDHAVLVVGYGTEDGQDYWLVKNSWGELWGEHGYIKMARNKDNQCGIALKASIPLV